MPLMALGFTAIIFGFDFRHLTLSVGLSVTVALVTCCLLVGLFYDGALEPSLAMRRATTYSIVGAVPVSSFDVSESFASDFVAQAFGFAERAGGWLAGSIVAIGSCRRTYSRRRGSVGLRSSPSPISLAIRR